MPLRIGTRGSRLALIQSGWVRDMLVRRHPGLQVELCIVKTTGDKIQDAPLSRIGGKGLFVKEIEDELLSRGVDLAVHSMKDVPMVLPPGLGLLAFPEREDPRDALISRGAHALQDLPKGVALGTSSLRRAAQILALRPDLRTRPMRGNVDTRLKKLEAGEVEALVLAMAGLRRMGLAHRATEALAPDRVLPAIGQGALGLEAREDNASLRELLGFLDHEPTRVCVLAERAFLRELEGGCQVPIAGYARLVGGEIHLDGLVAALDGAKIVREAAKGPRETPEALGTALAQRLLSLGAAGILSGAYENGSGGMAPSGGDHG